MKQLEKLIDRILNRVNINLREFAFDVEPYTRSIIPLNQLIRFYAFYGITSHNPLHFHFSHSNLAGSYFSGKCTVDNSVLYKSDIRGDELKTRGDVFHYKGSELPVHNDEVIRIKDSYLIKTLVHNHSHDPETLEEFLIRNTASMHYANIHGSPVEGCFLCPFSTVDITTVHDSVIGVFAYVQAGELAHQMVEPGQVWIRNGDLFDFSYRFPLKALNKYIVFETGKRPQGIFIDFIEERKADFQKVFNTVHIKSPSFIPAGAYLNPYAVFKGQINIDKNVLVAQRAYIEDAWLGKGANVQENCYIINSRLEGNNVTAHGAKIIHAQLGKKIFAGFNSFLRGRLDCPLTIGKGSIIMPHTIIDLEGPLDIPSEHLVWGYIKDRNDLKKHSLPLKTLSRIKSEFTMGSMRFKGSGASFVKVFQNRIEHILEANGAYFDGKKKHGHAQKGQNIAFNIIQPYLKGPLKGIYPTIDINP